MFETNIVDLNLSFVASLFNGWTIAWRSVLGYDSQGHFTGTVKVPHSLSPYITLTNICIKTFKSVSGIVWCLSSGCLQEFCVENPLQLSNQAEGLPCPA